MKTIVCGYGAMGKLLCEMLEAHHSAKLIGAIAPHSEEHPTWVKDNFSGLNTSFEVIIDFSHPTCLETILAQQKPTVICTTGHTDAQLQAIAQAAKNIPIVLASNTSQGVNLMHQLVKQAVRALAADFDIEIVEAHHNRKLDSPSGTAKSLLESIQSSLPEAYTVEYGRAGMAKRQTKEIGIHSLRAGTVVGEHTVVFAGEDELIEIKHTALSKKIFAKGAIRAAHFLMDKKSGLYNMQDVIR